MTTSLLNYLQQVQDFRTGRGLKHELWVVLLLIIMAVLSGSQSYLALEDFGQRHYPALREKLGLKTDKAPSDTTYRRILRQLDFQDLSAQFHNWMKQYVKLEAGEWLSLDGKSIKGTVSNYDNSYQNFVSLVSLYSHHQGIVVALKAFENKNQSEQKVVQYLLETLHLEGVIVTLDALHTQKKTIQLIRSSGNDYLVGVKANQPTLLNQLQCRASRGDPDSDFQELDTTRGRRVYRQVQVFHHLEGLHEQWLQPQSLIRVHRWGRREGQFFDEVHFYLSSLTLSAQAFADGIRGHWSIENSLHWVKDVVFREDSAPYCEHNCAINWSIVRNIALNLTRHHGFTSLTKAIRSFAHDFERLFFLVSE